MSSRKNVLLPYHLITATSMASAITSAATSIQYLDCISIQLNFNGSPTGAFAIQGSLDYVPGEGGTILNPGTWNAINLQPAPGATGSAGSILLDLFSLSFPYIRVMYTPASGSGTLDAYISGKAI